MEKESIAVIDYGTSNVRASIIDAITGEVIYHHSHKYPILSPQPGYLELSPENLWDSGVLCVREVFTRLLSERRYHVSAFSFSFFGDNLIPCDKKGVPIHNLILCFDPRGSQESIELNQYFGEQKLTDSLGAPFSNGCVPPKLLWLKKNMPDVFSSMFGIYNNQQYVLTKLGLPRLNDYSLACRLMLLDIDSRSWNTDILDYLGLSKAYLGDIAPASAIAGKITKYGDYSLPYEIPVAIGAHDAASGLFGSGITSRMENMVANVAGTFDHYGFTDFTGQLRGFRSAGCLDGMNVKMTAVAASGSLISWFMKHIHGDTEESSYQRFWSNSRFDGTNNLHIDPNFFSEGGSISGLGLNHTKQDIFDAIIETVTDTAADAFRTLCRERNEPVNIIRIGGGPSRSDSWNQHKANVLGVTVQRLANREVPTMGALTIGAHAIGMFADVEDAMERYIKVEKQYTPNSELHEIYANKKKQEEFV